MVGEKRLRQRELRPQRAAPWHSLHAAIFQLCSLRTRSHLPVKPKLSSWRNMILSQRGSVDSFFNKNLKPPFPLELPYYSFRFHKTRWKFTSLGDNFNSGQGTGIQEATPTEDSPHQSVWGSSWVRSYPFSLNHVLFWRGSQRPAALLFSASYI